MLQFENVVQQPKLGKPIPVRYLVLSTYLFKIILDPEKSKGTVTVSSRDFKLTFNF